MIIFFLEDQANPTTSMCHTVKSQSTWSHDEMHVKENRNKRLSKVKTLQRAIEYIDSLQQLINENDQIPTMQSNSNSDINREQELARSVIVDDNTRYANPSLTEGPFFMDDRAMAGLYTQTSLMTSRNGTCANIKQNYVFKGSTF